MAVQLRLASRPPLSRAPLPERMASEAICITASGRASKITPTTPSGTLRRSSTSPSSSSVWSWRRPSGSSRAATWRTPSMAPSSLAASSLRRATRGAARPSAAAASRSARFAARISSRSASRASAMASRAPRRSAPLVWASPVAARRTAAARANSSGEGSGTAASEGRGVGETAIPPSSDPPSRSESRGDRTRQRAGGSALDGRPPGERLTRQSSRSSNPSPAGRISAECLHHRPSTSNCPELQRTSAAPADHLQLPRTHPKVSKANQSLAHRALLSRNAPAPAGPPRAGRRRCRGRSAVSPDPRDSPAAPAAPPRATPPVGSGRSRRSSLPRVAPGGG